MEQKEILEEFEELQETMSAWGSQYLYNREYLGVMQVLLDKNERYTPGEQDFIIALYQRCGEETQERVRFMEKLDADIGLMVSYSITDALSVLNERKVEAQALFAKFENTYNECKPFVNRMPEEVLLNL